MEQIKHIAYSVLILVGAALTYSVLKPVLQAQWTASPAKTSAVSASPVQTTAIQNVAGKNLFSANCQTCHSVSKTLTGPALADVESRGPWTDRGNLVKWIKNPAAFVPTTEYTTDLVAQYNGQLMPAFPQLSDAEIGQIFDYIKETSAPPPALQ